MDQTGLWDLFFQTGLPQVWLAIQGEREETDAAAAMAPRREEPASG